VAPDQPRADTVGRGGPEADAVTMRRLAAAAAMRRKTRARGLRNAPPHVLHFVVAVARHERE
jgi:hypothetical protein